LEQIWHSPDEVSADGAERRLAKKRRHELVPAGLMYSPLASIASIAHCVFLLLKQFLFYGACTNITNVRCQTIKVAFTFCSRNGKWYLVGMGVNHRPSEKRNAD